MKIINLKNVSKFGKYADIQVVILPLMVLGMLHGFFNLIYTIINVWGGSLSKSDQFKSVAN